MSPELLAGQQGRRHEPKTCHGDRDQHEPSKLLRLGDGGIPEEESPQSEPETGFRRLVKRDQGPDPAGFIRGRLAYRMEGRSQADQQKDSTGNDLYSLQRRDSSSWRTTSRSEVWGKLAYHCPTA